MGAQRASKGCRQRAEQPSTTAGAAREDISGTVYCLRILLAYLYRISTTANSVGSLLKLRLPLRNHITRGSARFTHGFALYVRDRAGQSCMPRDACKLSFDLCDFCSQAKLPEAEDLYRQAFAVATDPAQRLTVLNNLARLLHKQASDV